MNSNAFRAATIMVMLAIALAGFLLELPFLVGFGIGYSFTTAFLIFLEVK